MAVAEVWFTEGEAEPLEPADMESVTGVNEVADPLEVPGDPVQPELRLPKEGFANLANQVGAQSPHSPGLT